MSYAKRWFELECRRCGQRFVDMAKLLFHRCPGRGDAVNAKRKGNRQEHWSKRIPEGNPTGRPIDVAPHCNDC